MKEVQLKRGGTTLVSDEDYERVMEWKWYLDSLGYISGFVDKKIVRLHRFILGATPGQHVDHINHVRTDNRRTNLRTCTNHQNRFNQKIKRNNTSGYKGVAKSHGKGKPWRAYINLDGRQNHLGVYPTAFEAAEAYNKAAVRYHGEFCSLNQLL